MVLIQILYIKSKDGPPIAFFFFFFFFFFSININDLNHATKFCTLYHFAETQIYLI